MFHLYFLELEKQHAAMIVYADCRFLFILPAAAKRFYTGPRYHRAGKAKAALKAPAEVWAYVLARVMEATAEILAARSKR